MYVYTGTISMLANYSLLCQNNMVIYTQLLASFEEVTLTGSKIYIISEQDIVITGSSFVNESIVQTECSCISLKKNCNWSFAYPQLFDLYGNFNITPYFQNPNYTMTPNNSATLIAQNQLTINSSTIRYSIIGIFS